MKKKLLSSVQRRLLREQDELELDMSEESEEVAPEESPEMGEDEAALDDIPVEESEPEEELEEPEEDKIRLLTTTIDSLEKMRGSLNKKGLLIAMQLSDFSTQRRIQSVSDELGQIVNHLNDKMLKTVAKSPLEMGQATEWLAGDE